MQIYLRRFHYLSSVEDDALIECPICNGEGVDLDGYICWKCKGQGQIKHENTNHD